MLLIIGMVTKSLFLKINICKPSLKLIQWKDTITESGIIRPDSGGNPNVIQKQNI
jgi:hypothetical protein